MELETKYTKGQTLYTKNHKGEWVECEYDHCIHVVKIKEGEYKGGTVFKSKDELFTEKPI